MTDMIEKVTTAICEAGGAHLACIFPDCACETIPKSAIAAIEALMVPNRTMLKAAGKAMSPEHRPTMKRVSVKKKHKIRYQAMMQAVLCEQP